MAKITGKRLEAWAAAEDRDWVRSHVRRGRPVRSYARTPRLITTGAPNRSRPVQEQKGRYVTMADGRSKWFPDLPAETRIESAPRRVEAQDVTYVTAREGGEFLNVTDPAERKAAAKRYSATVDVTSDGYGQVALVDHATGGFRSLFVSNPREAQAVTRTINAGRMVPREGFMH